jgi:hypothetical protein
MTYCCLNPGAFLLRLYVELQRSASETACNCNQNGILFHIWWIWRTHCRFLGPGKFSKLTQILHVHTTILNTIEFCLFGRKLSKFYSKVNVADIIHVKSDMYETVKFLLVVMTPFSLVDLVPPFTSKDGYDMFLTKHCFPFIRLLNVINQKIKCGSSENIFVSESRKVF